MQIEPYSSERLDAIVRLSLRAWSPVFDSIQKALDSEIYEHFYPDGWPASQQKAGFGLFPVARYFKKL
ncbi:hypothetical protein IQ247_02060 [Plectonema cf. radiosum LEGE 06105]|uniref:GNAT family N-acetyltransferase n=1 Tax=Plectonema cf. radiosum LEGE 06105 TaxID=945769 RepID=A0A8J7K171_9CYAN|nr:hypothetical protein [Plectonema radiosum]MBE9211512.1 hypothetical protein [Plectonema cf. radiosum LEGE 06105]